MKYKVNSRVGRLAAGMAAAIVTVGIVAGCEKVNAVAASVSPCFRVLPIAHAAVGSQAPTSPVDLARVRGSAVPRFVPLRPRTHATTTLPGAVPRQRDACIIAYNGPFDASKMPGRVVGPLRTGRYAVVVVAVRTQRVVSVFLTNVLPSPLHHH
jgi:hypothetical protein